MDLLLSFIIKKKEKHDVWERTVIGNGSAAT